MDRLPARNALDLVVEQVAGIDAWTREQRELAVSDVVVRSREMRLDSRNRLAARKREQEAVLARAQDHLSASGSLLGRDAPVRAVVAHRSEWLRQRLSEALGEAGVVVVASSSDGADAVGAVVVEQPDLLLLEDRLATVPGLDVARRARVLAPRTLVAVHVGDAGVAEAARAAGAHLVLPRQLSPSLMSEELLRVLRDGAPASSGSGS